MLSNEDIRNLPLPDLSMRILASVGREQANYNNLIQGFMNAAAYGTPQPSDMGAMLARLSDAWAWLETRALIGPSVHSPAAGNWQRITAMGEEVLKDSNAVARVWAGSRAISIGVIFRVIWTLLPR